ncbi:MAG: histidine kinase [Lewinella sp.]|nr:histidine kinase [Lewinella sp.]
MKLFEHKRNRILALILFWTCLMGAMNLMLIGTNAPPGFYYRNYSHIVSAILLTLININWLFPRYFQQKKYGAYLLITGFILIGFMFLHGVIEHFFFESGPKPPRPNSDALKPITSRPPRNSLFFNSIRIFDLMIYSAMVLVGTVLESIQLHRRQEHLAGLIQNEKLETEMKFLKSQINPHFLFNALNNVYTLSLIKSEQTPEVVMKLSEMLRYMLYESNQHRVSLDQEKHYIENYIALQHLKDDAPLAVNATFDLMNPQEQIAPMILIPFVENAFKHSKIEDTEYGWIDIALTTTGETIDFQVHNSIAPTEFTKDPTGGIGLTNVRRRLELEYPNRHRLHISREDQQFRVHLSIYL